MTLYWLELMSLHEGNPILIERLHDGEISANKTGNSFSRVAVDVALEQTINAKAKSRLKGIMAFADVASAVNRWVVTNSMRNQLANFSLELVDLKHTIDGNKELRQRRTEKDKYNLENIKSLLRSTLNPFNCITDKCVLFNIKTGRQIPKSGESYLLIVIKIGEEKGDAFVDECRQNLETFEQPLRRATIHNFASQNLLKKSKSKQIK